MIDILIKAGGFILIIMLGFALKTKGVCTREHGSFFINNHYEYNASMLITFIN